MQQWHACHCFMREQVLISFVYSVQSNLVDACSTFNVSTALSQSVFFLLTAQSLISFVAHYTGTYLMNWVAVAYNILCPFPKRIYLFFMFKFTFLPEYGSRQDHGEKNCGSSYIEFFDLGLQSTSQRTSASLVTRRMIYPLSNRCANAYLGTTLLFDFRFYFFPIWQVLQQSVRPNYEGDSQGELVSWDSGHVLVRSQNTNFHSRAFDLAYASLRFPNRTSHLKPPVYVLDSVSKSREFARPSNKMGHRNHPSHGLTSIRSRVPCCNWKQATIRTNVLPSTPPGLPDMQHHQHAYYHHSLVIRVMTVRVRFPTMIYSNISVDNKPQSEQLERACYSYYLEGRKVYRFGNTLAWPLFERGPHHLS